MANFNFLNKDRLAAFYAGLKRVFTLRTEHEELANTVSNLSGEYLKLTGGTLSGNLTVSKASGTTGVYSTRSDTGASIRLLVGSGGYNRGLQQVSGDSSGWMVYATSSHNVYLQATDGTNSSSIAVYPAGGVKLGSSTIGSGTKPVYLKSGTLTASSSTVGSSTTPVYLNSGTITACSSSITSSAQILYATCSTYDTTTAKVATLSSGSLTLAVGAAVLVYFTYAPTRMTTLNVNSTGAIEVSRSIAGTTDYLSNYVLFVYNGTYWCAIEDSGGAPTTSCGG